MVITRYVMMDMLNFVDTNDTRCCFELNKVNVCYRLCY